MTSFFGKLLLNDVLFQQVSAVSVGSSVRLCVGLELGPSVFSVRSSVRVGWIRREEEVCWPLKGKISLK
jgi:hypothetical protein